MPQRTLTKQGAGAVILATFILVIAGIVAIASMAWQPAAIGGLIAGGILVLGQVGDRLKP